MLDLYFKYKTKFYDISNINKTKYFYNIFINKTPYNNQ